MIDTLVLTTHGHIPENNLRKMSAPTTYHHDHDDDLKYTFYRYKPVNTYDPHIGYTLETRKLTITIPSVPRFLYNTGLIMMDDEMVPLFYTKLRRYLVNELGVESLPPTSEWEVGKLDIYEDFNLGDDVPYYIEALRQVRLPKYKEGNYRNETVYWRSGSKEIKFYDKHLAAIDKGEPREVIEQCRGIMRFETGINRQEISRFAGSTVLGDIFKESVMLPLMQQHLNRLNVMGLQITTKSEICRRLYARYGSAKAMKLAQFIELQQMGFETDLSYITIYRYRQDITNAGIAPVIATRELPPLIITSRPSTIVKLAHLRRNRLAA